MLVVPIGSQARALYRVNAGKNVKVSMYGFLVLFGQKLVWITKVLPTGMAAILGKVWIRRNGQGITTIPIRAITFIRGNFRLCRPAARGGTLGFSMAITGNILHLLLQTCNGLNITQDLVRNKSVIRSLGGLGSTVNASPV